jgi:hypothetical protein
MENQSFPLAQPTLSLTVAYTKLQSIPVSEPKPIPLITFWNDTVPHLEETVQKPEAWGPEWFANYE